MAMTEREDDRVLEPFFAAARRLAERENPRARAKGLRRTAQLWHFIGEHEQAAKSYSQLIPIMETLVREKSRTQADLGSDHYGRACALALLGRTGDAMVDLRKAVEYRGVDVNTLKKDREIDSLRELPGFAEILRLAPSRRR